MNTKKCTKCKKPQALEMFPSDSRTKDGRKPHCRLCVSKYNHQHYLDRHIPKPKPVLLSWQPKPGDRFEACLMVDLGDKIPLERIRCELSPFVCEENRDQEVIATSLDSRWTLDKSSYIFVRP